MEDLGPVFTRVWPRMDKKEEEAGLVVGKREVEVTRPRSLSEHLVVDEAEELAGLGQGIAA